LKTDVNEALGIKRLNVLEKRNDYELKKLIPDEFIKRFVISRGHNRVNLRTTRWRRK
jgi:hypothetical protein